MAGPAQTHKTTRRGIVKSTNQAGFLPKDLTPSVDGSPNFLRRSESEPFPKSGRLISVSTDISRTSPTVFRSAARRAFWILPETIRVRSAYRPAVLEWERASDPRSPLEPGVLCGGAPDFHGMLSGFFMVGDRLLRLPHSESFSLSSRQARIGAFLVVGHFPFAFGIHFKPAGKR